MGISDAINALHAEVRREISRSSVEAFADEKRTLAQLLIDERAQQGLSLQDVAERMGSAKNYVWQLESNRSKNPTVKIVDAIANALGVSVMRVFRAALNSVDANS